MAPGGTTRPQGGLLGTWPDYSGMTASSRSVFRETRLGADCGDTALGAGVIMNLRIDGDITFVYRQFGYSPMSPHERLGPLALASA